MFQKSSTTKAEYFLMAQRNAKRVAGVIGFLAKTTTAFSASPAPVTISALPDGTYIDVNQAFLRTTGYAREEDRRRARDAGFDCHLTKPLEPALLRELLATLREIGYCGPIALMCYGIPGDAREHLTRSMKAWKTWQAEWAKK